MKYVHRALVVLLVFFTVMVGVMPSHAEAAPVPSSSGVPSGTRQQDLQRIGELLSDPTILEGLREAGTSAGELEQLLPRMTDHDVHLLAAKMDHVKAGGIGVVEVLVVVLLVILIIYLVRYI